MAPRRILIPALATALIALPSCMVSQQKYNRAKKQLQDYKIRTARANTNIAYMESRYRARLATQRSRIEAFKELLASKKKRVTRLEGVLQLYEKKTRQLESRIRTAKQKLGDAKSARRSTRRQLQRYRRILKKFTHMVEAGDLSIDVRGGKMVLQLTNNILFDSGGTSIKGEGKEALQRLAKALRSVEGREFLIAGHTDDVPISSDEFDSNWSLSTARAVNVVEYLENKGVNPKRLAAAGYGPHDPIASNETAEGRSKNRRIEIIVMPNLSELPTIPDEIAKSK